MKSKQRKARFDMQVELIAHSTPICEKYKYNPMKVVEQAASVCYDSEPDFHDYRIAKGCAKTGHMSVYEHAYFTFHVSGISRACLAQLSRHRHISLSVRSQRYCDESGKGVLGCIIPKAFNDEQFEIAMQTYSEEIDKYQVLLASGADKEDARMVLPNAMETELYLSANARALIEASHLRLCNRAQEEIRTMFGKMKQEVELVSPEIAKMMVPQCEVNPSYPFCTERKSCGRHKTLKEVYKSDV
nr:MAG TPA: Thymidylate synthase complementing protein [Bacteriophage sp.]